MALLLLLQDIVRPSIDIQLTECNKKFNFVLKIWDSAQRRDEHHPIQKFGMLGGLNSDQSNPPTRDDGGSSTNA